MDTNILDKSKTLLIATNNPGKVIELNGLLAEMSWNTRNLNDFPNIAEVPETGVTFEENARLKATGYARETGLYALADDSGLEVTALGGRPGVYSARYGGEGTSFTDKMAMLLAELDKSGNPDRSARFVCSIAIAEPAGDIIYVSEGVCHGWIGQSPLGSCGFGYDPLFIPDGFDQTFGELPDTLKQKISHRSEAIRQIIPFLQHFITV
ncbi:XTP/dITP diphosphatase [soil metagenome]